MPVRREVIVLVSVCAVALTSCDKKSVRPTLAGAQSAAALGRPASLTSEASVAASPATTPMEPKEIAAALRDARMPTGAAGFSFPDPPTCEDAGPKDRFVTRCGFNVVDDRGGEAGIVAVELYDRDLDFDTQANMLKTMVQGLSANTIASIDPTFKFRRAGGAYVAIHASCAQPLDPRGPAFCMLVLPSRRTLMLTMVKPAPGGHAGEADIDRAESLSMMALGLMPGRSMTE